MVMTSAVLGRRPTRDPDDDVETRVYEKPPMPWDRLMVLQIMRELEPRGAHERPAPSPRAGRPSTGLAQRNVFLTPPLPSDPPPPWATSRRALLRRESSPRETALRASAAARQKAARPKRARVSVAPATPQDRETLVRRRWQHRAPRRMILPWILFAMYFLIAFGVGRDRTLRMELVSQLRHASVQGAATARASAGWLQALPSRIGL